MNREKMNKERMLIVDDDSTSLKTYSKIFSDAGFLVSVARNSKEAFARLNENVPDIVLLDVMLGVESGLDVLKQIKESPDFQDAFVVMVSGVMKSSEQQATGLEQGADGYITRPMEKRQLLARIEAFMRHKRTLDALRESRAKYKRVSDNSPAVLYQYLMTPDGEISFPYVSDRVEAIFGVTPADVMEDPRKLIGKVHPDDRDLFQKGIERAAQTLESFPLRFRCNIGGQVIWIEARGMPTPLEDGSIQWDGFLVDITKQKQAEMDLRDRMEQVRRLNRAMTGREERMIELKRQVNELCERLGEKPPYALDFLDKNTE